VYFNTNIKLLGGIGFIMVKKEQKQCNCAECGGDLYSLHNILNEIEATMEEIKLHVDKMTDDDVKRLGRPIVAALYFEGGRILAPSPQWHGSEELAHEVILAAIPPPVKKRGKKHG
jgi:hypothetical protein